METEKEMLRELADARSEIAERLREVSDSLEENYNQGNLIKEKMELYNLESSLDNEMHRLTLDPKSRAHWDKIRRQPEDVAVFFSVLNS